MTLKPGEQILGRFEVLGPLPPWGELRRFSARDTATGAQVDLHLPAPEVRIRPNAAERFRAATRSLPSSPATSAPLAAGEHKGHAIAAYPAAEGWARHGALRDDQLRALAGWLLSSVDPLASALGGTLRPEDLVLRDGAPHIQPTGIQPRAARAVPDPFQPPGDGSPEAGARYGLGLLLYEAATGSPPFSTKTLSDLARQQAHPPRIRDARPDRPAELDQLIADLMSPDPAPRLRAALPAPAAPPILPVEAAAATPAAPSRDPGIVVTREPTQRGARRDVPLEAWVVTAQLAGVPETLRRRLAAAADLPDAALAQAAVEGATIPVASARTEAEAQALAERLSRASVPLAVEPSSRRSTTLLAGGGLVAGAGLLAMLAIGALMAVWGLPMIVLLLLTSISLLLMLGGGAVAGFGALSSGVPAALREGQRLLSEARPAASAMDTRMQAARRALLDSELPEAARVDLLSALDALQEALPRVDKDSERQQVEEAVADIIAAAEGANRHESGASEAAAEASRRAHAAQVTIRELR